MTKTLVQARMPRALLRCGMISRCMAKACSKVRPEMKVEYSAAMECAGVSEAMMLLSSCQVSADLQFS